MNRPLCIVNASTKEDFHTFWHMFDNCVVEMVHQGIFDDVMLEWFLSDTYRSDFASRCQREKNTLKVFLIGSMGKCIGFCTCVWDGNRSKKCEITCFFLKGAYRGKGLGQHAWREMERRMCQDGICQFTTSEACGSCSRFWNANGFQQTGVNRWEKRRKRYSRYALF